MSLLQNMIGNAASKENGLLTPGKVRIVAAVFCLLSFGVGLFFTDALQYFLGTLLGGAMAQLIFWQNEKSVQKIVQQTDKTRAMFYNRRDYTIRMILRAAAVVIGYFNPNTNLVAVILGLFSITAAIYVLTFASNAKMQKEAKAGKAEDANQKEETK